jgi:hypothetical protein
MQMLLSNLSGSASSGYDGGLLSMEEIRNAALRINGGDL